MKNRKEQLKTWLRSFFSEKEIYNLKLMPTHASFRKYYRIYSNKGSWVIMDAPLSSEKPDIFYRVSRLMEHYNIQVPECKQFNQEDGFILISDLGDKMFSEGLNLSNMEKNYQKALSLLVELLVIDSKLVPEYEYSKFMSEQQLLSKWFFKLIDYHPSVDHTLKFLELFEYLSLTANNQPKIFIHRDFHSKNIMVMGDDSLGLIDFQDALRGPVTYDIVSLLKDCYVSWPRSIVLEFVESYWLELKNINICDDISLNEFIKWFDLMGLQRHLKCLGIFSRLSISRNREDYLKDIPRVIAYIEEVLCLYGDLKDYAKIWIDEVQPRVLACQNLNNNS